MREIKNDLKAGKIQKIDLKSDKLEKTDSEGLINASEHDEAVVKDFSNPKAETLGRSQVNQSDNIETDIAFGIAHPQKITDADKFFDLAFKKLSASGDTEAYEKASAMTDIFTRKEQLAGL